MTKEQLLKKLAEIADELGDDRDLDFQDTYGEAVEALLEFLEDEEIASAFKTIEQYWE